MARALTLALAVALVPAAASARGGEVRGNGQKTTVRRDVPAFTAVRVEGHLDVDVKVGPPQSVAVTIDSNLQEHVVTRVERGTLVLGLDRDGSYSWKGAGRVDVTVPALRSYRMEGAGDTRIEGGAGDLELAVDGSGDLRWSGTAGKLKVRIGGSSEVTLEGRADALDAGIDGSGDVHAAGLTARDVSVDVSGTGDAEVRVGGGALAASVEGTGNVTWHGNASSTSTSVSGTGSIVQR